MIRKSLLSLVLSAFVFCIAASAQGIKRIDFDRGTANKTIKRMDTSVPAVSEKEITVNAELNPIIPAEKEWTVMVFINGKNNLEKYGLKDLNEMEAVGSNNKMNVVVEIGRMGFFSGEGGWKGTRRYYVEKDKDMNNVTSPIVMDLGKTDMGSYKSVIDFVNWSKTNYPAKRYMLILWNHGSGWLKSLQDGKVSSRGISYDDETNNHITTPQTAEILKAVGGVDILGSDACLMQMASINYEIKDYVKYIVASEETEPGDGYPYDKFLNYANKSTLSMVQMAKAVVNAYADDYTGKKTSHTQAAVNASKMKGLKKVTDEWVTAVKANVSKEDVRKAVGSTLFFAYDDNKDLYDFVVNIAKVTKNEEVLAAGEALKTFITDELMLINRTADFKSYSWYNGEYMTEYHKAKGIAVYLPGTKYDTNYDELKWAKESQWANFVKWYLK